VVEEWQNFDHAYHSYLPASGFEDSLFSLAFIMFFEILTRSVLHLLKICGAVNGDADLKQFLG